MMAGYRSNARHPASQLPPVLTINSQGRSPFVLVCDHASNRIPSPYGDLGLKPHQRLTHIAWDPGALAVSLQLADLLDAPLVQSTVSRLVIDCNRGPQAVDLIPVMSERTEIRANIGIPDSERARRLAAFHAPFHRAVDAVLDRRLEAGQEAILVCIHSFTPTYKDVPRPWPVGLIPGSDESLTRALFAALKQDGPELNIGWNEPYAARKEVTYTVEEHGDRRGLPTTMIEIRHDEILEPAGVALWSARLGRALEAARLAWRQGPMPLAGAAGSEAANAGP
jgi:predicted N-formylglutamate amidohydrolase